MGKLKDAEAIVEKGQPLRMKLEEQIREKLLYWDERRYRARKVLAENERLKRG